MMLYGYAGKILRVNLTEKTHHIEPLPEYMAREYIGGRGFVAKILYDEIEIGIDPLGPKNKLIIAPGPLTGVFLTAGGKTELGTLSPETGGYGDSNIGGHIGPEIKYAGYDMIILEGKAPEKTYLYIEDNKIEFRDASKYWGMECMEAEKALKSDLGEDFQILLIGPAGENMVKFACISHDYGRQAGRTGVGAVMGSKNLKAIAVKGTHSIPLYDKDEVINIGKQMFKACKEKDAEAQWSIYGTIGVTDWCNEVGAFPTKNFYDGWNPNYKNLNGPTAREEIIVRDKGCFCCPIPCGKYSHVKKEGYDVYVEGPEYESNALIGGSCYFDDIKDVAYGNAILDELGMDSISGGNVIAFAMECFERGVITKEDTDGREIKFGDIDSFKYLAEKIAKRDGIGDLLAEGVKRASKILGRGSEDYAIQIKGLEWSGYESRYAPANMLAYMTCDVGAHHNRAWAITYDVATGRDKLEGKADRVIELQHIRPLFDMLGCCRLQWVEISLELDYYPRILKAVTGFDYDMDDLLKLSEKVWNLTRAFWKKHNPDFGRSWDYPPARIMNEPIPSGPAQGKYIPKKDLDWLLDDYYKKRGWTEDGIPTREKLEELGLNFAVKDLYGV
ncbi:MAG: aldehyde ferredoxin oxidoreductase family protein [Thermoanaerobacteraceae bacterium]|nr:aldehyde ferredoxin oxidoreductase family protein [Thermoanaerobacteraceae bacterium]